MYNFWAKHDKCYLVCPLTMWYPSYIPYILTMFCPLMSTLSLPGQLKVVSAIPQLDFYCWRRSRQISATCRDGKNNNIWLRRLEPTGFHLDFPGPGHFYWGKIRLDLLLLPMNSKYIFHHVSEQYCPPSPPYQSSPLLGDFSNGSPWITSKAHSLPP